jgi:NTP pyrophosphatase (non-canonical NTP hydrolase)
MIGVYGMVENEIERQVELHGDRSCGSRNTSAHEKVTILAEEVGEVAHAVLEGDTINLADELVQVAAIAVAWLRVLED